MSTNTRITEGDLFNTNQCGLCEVIEYNGCSDIKVRFIETGYSVTCQAGSLRRGQVKDKLAPTVHGVGFIGAGKYKPTLGRKATPAYKHWVGMLERAYSDKYHAKNPTYADVTVDEAWHNFQTFAKWFEEAYVDGWHLDKDMLSVGSKVYSPNTCLIIPQAINTLLLNNEASRGSLPQGVSRVGNRYRAAISEGKRRRHIGLFTDILAAVNAYWDEKEAVVRRALSSFQLNATATESVMSTFWRQKQEALSEIENK